MRVPARTFPIAIVALLLLVSLAAVAHWRISLHMAGGVPALLNQLTIGFAGNGLPDVGQPGGPTHAKLPDDIGTARMGIQLKDGDHTHFDLVESAGFGMVRKGLYWSRVEQAKGQYDFAWFDEILALAKARGMVVSVTLYGNNPLYGHRQSDGVAIISEEQRRGFAKFAAAAAARYAGEPVVFEIWNEPNLRQFWRVHPARPDKSNLDAMADEYTLLVQEVVPAMKAADPSVFVSAGSISALWWESFSWFDRTVEKGILDSGIDAISVHPYGFEWPELAGPGGYATIRRKLADAGRTDIRLVNSEAGFPATDWITDRGYSQEEAIRLQGALLIRQQLLDRLYGIDYTIWYEFRSADTYGIVGTGGDIRPAFTAAKTMGEQLQGYRLVGRVETARPEDFMLRFTNGRQDRIVAWTSPPRLRDKAVPHPIKASFDVASVVDCFGRELPVKGRLLELSEYPQFVTIRSGDGGSGHHPEISHGSVQ